jgi:hypothetical protein
MKKLTILLAVFALLLAGCGNKTKEVTSTGSNGQVTTQKVPDVHFAKTKFILHTGLAFGAFHRYIVKPLKAGTFKKGAPGRKKAFLKAGAAGLFIIHELNQSRRAALSDDKLRPLAQKVGSLGTKIAGLAAALKGGSLNPAAILGADGEAGALGSASKGLGAQIKDRVVPSLGG